MNVLALAVAAALAAAVAPKLVLVYNVLDHLLEAVELLSSTVHLLEVWVMGHNLN